MGKRWVLIDVSWLTHRARTSMPDLEHDEEPTAVTFGFLEQLRGVCESPHVSSNRVALFFDSRHSHRKESYPGYKNKRNDKRTEEEIASIIRMKKQVLRLRKEFLPYAGFPCYTQRGLESDDLMAQAALSLPPGDDAVMITADRDLLQCVSRECSFWDPQRGEPMGPADVWRKVGVPPEMWADVKALAGCATDDVEGIGGVGEKTAASYMMKLLKPGSHRHKLIESPPGRKIYKRNLPLVTLPHAKTREFILREPDYNPDLFYRKVREWGMKSYLEGRRRASWDLFFNNFQDRVMTAMKSRRLSGR